MRKVGGDNKVSLVSERRAWRSAAMGKPDVVSALTVTRGWEGHDIR